MKKYLKYIKNKYSDFRYFSDKNTLENLDLFEKINYKIISNEMGFCVIYTDFRISKKTCFFGFLEIYDKNNSEKFFEKIKREAKNIGYPQGTPLQSILVGPINFSVWNSYRFGNFENNEKTILGEYETDKNLNKIFLDNKFRIYEKYITAKRFGENPYPTPNPSLVRRGMFKIKQIETNKETLKLIFDLSSQIFKKAPKINFLEFEKYMKVYLDLYKNKIGEFILTYKGKNIGFLSSFYTDKYFVIKTVGILKEFRGKGLGNYILNYVYDYYLNLGFKKSYYLYMREKGDALNMCQKNAEIHREYFTYYIDL